MSANDCETMLSTAPRMIAAIGSDARFATARTGSSVTCASSVMRALAVPEPLADEIGLSPPDMADRGGSVRTYRRLLRPSQATASPVPTGFPTKLAVTRWDSAG